MTMEYLPIVRCLMNMVCFCHIQNFLKKINIPVKPKYYAVIFDVISSKFVSLLRNSSHINADQQPLNCDILCIGDINIVKDKCSNRYIRNVLKKNFVPCSTVFWSSKYKNIEWKFSSVIN